MGMATPQFTVKANTYCKIIFNLGNGKDVQEIARCAGLTQEETEYIDWLEVGQGIVNLKSRVLVPLHVLFPRVEVEKGLISDCWPNSGRTSKV